MGIVFAFLLKFPVSFINFIQYHLQYRELQYQKVIIWAQI